MRTEADGGCCRRRSARKHWFGLGAGALTAILLPKCPMCLAAYLTLLGLSGALATPILWLRPAAIALAIVSAAALAIHTLRARRARSCEI